MKLLLLASAVLAAAAVPAAEFTYGAAPGAAVPDGNDSGFVSTLVVPDLGLMISGLTVSLTLRGGPLGGWNGDLYAHVAHEGALSVLLNRPGRTATRPLGYNDNGFLDVTFDDAAPADVHLYRDFGGASPVTGLWQPDARATDPAAVRDTDSRTLFLGGFDNLPAAGEWRLFVADLLPGGDVVLESWSITFRSSVDPIPEPGTLAGGAALLLLAAAAGRRRLTGAWCRP
ncbi:MAG TPA: PEP-CTERM sorting domain-containing protein [Verrucomicrobiota bacterium]|nr:PEP-CTERM sorting domain-containing protein [Verrucomicrobiota bacterium]